MKGFMQQKLRVCLEKLCGLQNHHRIVYDRRGVVSLMLLVFLALPLLATPLAVQADRTAVIKVFKSATCGCCTKWVDHLRAAGFTVEATNMEDMARLKRENGISEQIESCHTAFVAGYFIEGHVPAQDVKRLLTERPKIAGLAVPEMPVGSPGMEGKNPVVYDVLAVDSQGKTAVYATHRPAPLR